MKKIIIPLILLISIQVNAQNVPVHTDYYSIYEFLDEMANEGYIDLFQGVKPFSRKFIAEKLDEVKQAKGNLNKRQQEELLFFSSDFNKEILPLETSEYVFKRYFQPKSKDFLSSKRQDLYYYSDGFFTFTLNPILGYTSFSNDSGNFFWRYNGLSATANIGKHWGIYANLRDNHESKLLTSREAFVQHTGAAIKFNYNDYSEMRGGISYNWDWGNIGLVKDHVEWGNNYHGANIFSGQTPSFGMIKLQLKPVKWFEFNYFHGYLISEVVDSSKTYSTGTFTREVYRDKMIAANMFTIKPIKKLYFSFGNSVIYSDISFRPEFYIPFLFYKSVDHTLNGANSNYIGQNSQMFFDFSTRLIPKTHLYATLFIDEIALGRMFDPEKQTNYISFKGGAKVAPIKNLSLVFEYTRTNPGPYRHIITTTTFESNNYQLGHYLGDNAQEIYGEIEYRAFKNFRARLYYSKAQKGPDKIIPGESRRGMEFMEFVEWENLSYGINLSWQFINDVYFHASYSFMNVSDEPAEYIPQQFIGKQKLFTAGLNFGF